MDIRLTQWIGRSFREKNPYIDQLVDDDSSIEKQWQTALELYKHMGAKVNVEAYDPSLFADADADAAENETEERVHAKEDNSTA